MEEITQAGLEGNEYVSLLSWVMNTYCGPELMSHPELNVDLTLVQSLISAELLKELETQYLKTMERNYQDWMSKTVETEKQEWLTDQMPEQDHQDKCYHTSAPVIIFQMIDQHLQVTNTIHADLTFNALVMSIQQLTKYGHQYRQGAIELKDRHFKDRSQMPFFTQHMITIVNNCQKIIELSHEMKHLYWPKSKTEHYNEFEHLLQTFQLLRNEVASFLLDEAFLDLEIHFNDLFTSKWESSNVSVDTICVTLEDYFQDYNHLSAINFEYVINRAQNLVKKRYIRAMLSKRMAKPRANCEIISKKIIREAKQIKMFFSKIAPNLVDNNDSSTDLIYLLAILFVCDIEMLVLDLHTILGSYPSLTEDHLMRLFYIRSDIKVAEVREKIQDAMKSKKLNVSIDKQDEIFRDIVFSDKLW